MTEVTIYVGDSLDTLRALPDHSAHCIVTSPPYFGLRVYCDDPREIGREQTPREYVERLVEVFREARRVLRDDGTLWLNLGDSYAGNGGGSQGATSQRVGRRNTEAQKRSGSRGGDGLKPKDLIGIPWMVAFALRDDGWYLRSDCIWEKPNAMPSSVRDRPTTSHEYVFMLTKSARYYADMDAVREPQAEVSSARRKRQDLRQKNVDRDYAYLGNAPKGIHQCKPSESRNLRTVWTIPTQPFSAKSVGIEDADHYAVMAPALVERCIKIGCPEGGVVLDPFGGAGTTATVAAQLGRDSVLCELNPASVRIAEARVRVKAHGATVRVIDPGVCPF